MAAPSPAPCPRCNDSGWIPANTTDNRVEPCGCQGELRKTQRIASAGIPKRYRHCTLDAFRPSSTTLRNAATKIERFIHEWPHPDGGKGFLLTGPVGTGKTHLAVAALLGIIENGGPGKLVFANFSDLIQEIQASFDSDHLPTKAQLLGPLIDADLLVIDELGAQKPTEWIKDTLYYIINSRYSDAKTTIFTTNYGDNPEEAKESNLQSRIGPPLRSRIYEMAWRIDMAGVDDYRRKKW